MAKVVIGTDGNPVSFEKLKAAQAVIRGDRGESNRMLQADRDIRMMEIMLKAVEDGQQLGMDPSIDFTPERVQAFNRAVEKLEETRNLQPGTLQRINGLGEPVSIAPPKPMPVAPPVSIPTPKAPPAQTSFAQGPKLDLNTKAGESPVAVNPVLNDIELGMMESVVSEAPPAPPARASAAPVGVAPTSPTMPVDTSLDFPPTSPLPRPAPAATPSLAPSPNTPANAVLDDTGVSIDVEQAAIDNEFEALDAATPKVKVEVDKEVADQAQLADQDVKGAKKSESELLFGSKNAFPISSGFGTRTHPTTGEVHKHTGVDIAVPKGTRLQAPVSLKIIASSAADKDSRGKYLIGEDADGNTYRFYHLDSVSAPVGSTVLAGASIGTTGNTGRSTGQHLHLEVRDPSGVAISPLKHLRSLTNIEDAPAVVDNKVAVEEVEAPDVTLTSEQVDDMLGLEAFESQLTPLERADNIAVSMAAEEKAKPRTDSGLANPNLLLFNLYDYVFGGQNTDIEVVENLPQYIPGTSVLRGEETAPTPYASGVIRNYASGDTLVSPGVRPWGLETVPQDVKDALADDTTALPILSVLSESGQLTTKDRLFIDMVQTGGRQIGVDAYRIKAKLKAWYTATEVNNAIAVGRPLSYDEQVEAEKRADENAERVIREWALQNPNAAFIDVSKGQDYDWYAGIPIIGPVLAMMDPSHEPEAGWFNTKGQLLEGQKVTALAENDLSFLARMAPSTVIGAWMLDEKVRRAGWGSPEHIAKIRAGYDFGEDLDLFTNVFGDDAHWTAKVAGGAAWFAPVLLEPDIFSIISGGSAKVGKAAKAIGAITGLNDKLFEVAKVFKLTQEAKAAKMVDDIDEAIKRVEDAPESQQFNVLLEELRKVERSDAAVGHLVASDVGSLQRLLPDTLIKLEFQVKDNLARYRTAVSDLSDKFRAAMGKLGAKDQKSLDDLSLIKTEIEVARLWKDKVVKDLADFDEAGTTLKKVRMALGIDGLTDMQRAKSIIKGMEAGAEATQHIKALRKMVPNAELLPRMIKAQLQYDDLEKFIKLQLEEIKAISKAQGKEAANAARVALAKIIKPMRENYAKIMIDALGDIEKVKPFVKSVRAANNSVGQMKKSLPGIDPIMPWSKEAEAQLDELFKAIIPTGAGRAKILKELDDLDKQLVGYYSMLDKVYKQRLKLHREIVPKYIDRQNRKLFTNLQELDNWNSVQTRVLDILRKRRDALASIADKTLTPEGRVILNTWNSPQGLMLTKGRWTNPKNWADIIRYNSMRVVGNFSAIKLKFGNMAEYHYNKAKAVSATFDQLRDEMTWMAKQSDPLVSIVKYITDAAPMQLRHGRSVANGLPAQLVRVGEKPESLTERFFYFMRGNLKAGGDYPADINDFVKSIARAYLPRGIENAEATAKLIEVKVREYIIELADRLDVGEISAEESIWRLDEFVMRATSSLSEGVGRIDNRKMVGISTIAQAVSSGAIYGDHLRMLLIDQMAILKPEAFSEAVAFQSAKYTDVQLPDAVVDVFDYLGMPLIQRNVYTDAAQEFGGKGAEVTTKLASRMVVVKDAMGAYQATPVYYPAHLIARVEQQTGLLIQDLPKVEGLAWAPWIKSIVQSALNTWRRTAVLGIGPFVKAGHWVNEYWGSVGQIFMIDGSVSASKVAFSEFGSYLPFGNKLNEVFAGMTGPGKLGSIFSSMLNVHTTKVLEGSDEVIRGTNYTYRQLQEMAMTGGLFDTRVHESIMNTVRHFNLDEIGGQGTWANMNDAIRDHLITAQQRMRVSLFAEHVINRGTSPNEALRITKDALYDWKHPISNFEIAYIAQVSSFYRFFKLAMHQTASVALQPFTLLSKPSLSITEMYRETERFRRLRAMAMAQQSFPAAVFEPNRYDLLDEEDRKLYLANTRAPFNDTGNYFGATRMDSVSAAYFETVDGTKAQNATWAQYSPPNTSLEMYSTLITLPKMLYGIIAASTSSDRKLPQDFFRHNLKPWVDMLAPGFKDIAERGLVNAATGETGGVKVEGGVRQIIEGTDYVTMSALQTMDDYRIGDWSGAELSLITPHPLEDGRIVPSAHRATKFVAQNIVGLAGTIPSYLNYIHYTPKNSYNAFMAGFLRNFLFGRARPYNPEDQLNRALNRRAQILKDASKAAEAGYDASKARVDQSFNR